MTRHARPVEPPVRPAADDGTRFRAGVGPQAAPAGAGEACRAGGFAAPLPA